MLDNGSIEEMGPYGIVKAAAIEDALIDSRPRVDELHRFIETAVHKDGAECPQQRFKQVGATQSWYD